MNKRTRKASKNQPESFSIVVNMGEALVYKNSTITPNCNPYLVTGTTVALSRDVILEWFVNNIVPLVGQDAANEMKSLLAERQNPHVSGFLDGALRHRRELK